MCRVKSAGEFQALKFRGLDKATGKKWGLKWDTDEDGVLIPDSTRYVCEHCGHEHINADKSTMLPAGEWRATARAQDPTHRSYHISALYSPAGMMSWESCAKLWMKAWDDDLGQAKDFEALQVFYNNVLGEPYKVYGSKIKFEAVSAHRRAEYRFGQVPNKFAEQYMGGRVLMLTCTVDVHKSNLGCICFRMDSRPAFRFGGLLAL